MAPTEPPRPTDRTYAAMTRIAQRLYERFGRPPTEAEVAGMINGDDAHRLHIWNYGLKENEDGTD